MRFVVVSCCVVGFCIGGELRPYVQMGIVGGGATATSNQQSMSKEVATCPVQADGSLLCIGDSTRGEYQGNLGNGFNAEIGGEYFIDKLGISGVRLFGEISVIGGGLGNLTSSARDTSSNNLAVAKVRCNNEKTGSVNCGVDGVNGILIIKPGTTVTEEAFSFQETPDPQTIAPNSGKWMTFGIGVDGFVNVPIDYWLREYLNFGDGWFLRRLGVLKIGVFVGGGVEFSRFSQGSWQNLVAGKGKAQNLNDAFFAAGSGGFLRYGVQAYITKFLRINFGFKDTFYEIASERWYRFDGLAVNASGTLGAVRPNDGWSETLLRQKFVVSKEREWFLSMALSF